jgi:N-acetylneuraminic acid mutarotase
VKILYSTLILFLLLIICISGCKKEDVFPNDYPEKGEATINISGEKLGLTIYTITAGFNLNDETKAKNYSIVVLNESNEEIKKYSGAVPHDSAYFERIVTIDSLELNQMYSVKAYLFLPGDTIESATLSLKTDHLPNTLLYIIPDHYQGFYQVNTRICPNKTFQMILETDTVLSPLKTRFLLNNQYELAFDMPPVNSVSGNGGAPRYRWSFDLHLDNKIPAGKYDVSCQMDGLVIKSENQLTVVAGEWAQLPSTDEYGIVNSGYFQIGKYGYSVLGNPQSDMLFKMRRFDLEKESWEYVNNFPAHLLNSGGYSTIASEFCCVIENKGYMVASHRKANHLEEGGNCIYRYDPQQDSWEYVTTFPSTPRSGVTGFEIDGKIYIGCGVDFALYQDGMQNDRPFYHREFWCYDTRTNQWTQVARFPGELRVGATGFSINGKGYVCFGGSPKGNWSYGLIIYETNDVWEYDPANNSWARKNDFPDFHRYAALSVNVNDRIFIAGGTYYSMSFFNSWPAINDCWEYLPATDTWVPYAESPLSSGDGILFGYKNNLYFGYGSNDGQFKKEFYKLTLPDENN